LPASIMDLLIAN